MMWILQALIVNATTSGSQLRLSQYWRTSCWPWCWYMCYVHYDAYQSGDCKIIDHSHLKKNWRIHDPIRRPICFDSAFSCNEVSTSAAGCLSVVCLSLWWCVAIIPMSMCVFTTLFLLKKLFDVRDSVVRTGFSASGFVVQRINLAPPGSNCMAGCIGLPTVVTHWQVTSNFCY